MTRQTKPSRRPPCGKDPDTYRAHILKWRLIPGTQNDWTCDICDKN